MIGRLRVLLPFLGMLVSIAGGYSGWIDKDLALVLSGLIFGAMFIFMSTDKADGMMLVRKTDDKITYSLELFSDIEKLGDKPRVVFKVEDDPL